MRYLESAMASNTKELTILNVDFHNPEELARFHAQELAIYRERKKKIVVDLKREGYLDEYGNWHFKEPLPEDMRPDSKADFTH